MLNHIRVESVLKMDQKHKHLITRVSKLKKAIRKKYRDFKDGIASTELELEKQYKPILTELKKSKTDIKIEPKQESKDEHFEEEFVPSSTPLPGPSSTRKFIPFMREESVHEAGESDEEPELSSVLASPRGAQSASQFVEQNFENELTRKYMNKLFKGLADNRLDKIDHTYGPRYEQDTLQIGDQHLTFDSDGTLFVGNTQYRPTEGLYELIFKREPNNQLYTDEDLNTYKNILLQSNAHKKQYKYNNNVNRIYKSLKYKNIISQLFPARPAPLKKGTGLKWKSAKTRDIMHWDDPNELVDRLKHLVMSTEAGNQGHSNEILNIVEELRESRYISGKGNSRFSLLIK